MMTSPTFAIGTALLIAVGLVLFGIRRLVTFFHEEYRKGNDSKEPPYNLDPAHKFSACQFWLQRPEKMQS